MDGMYVLKGKKTKPCNDFLKWGFLFEKTDRSIARTTRGKVTVSTIFLGLDYSFLRRRPLLFETMIFGGKFAGAQWRYATFEEAEKSHVKARLIAGLRQKKKMYYIETNKSRRKTI